MSQRRVVSGHVLGRSVLSRVVRLGGIRLGQRAQAHEQGQGKSQSGEPQWLAPQHLRAPKRHRGFRGHTPHTSVLCLPHPSRHCHPRPEFALHPARRREAQLARTTPPARPLRSAETPRNFAASRGAQESLHERCRVRRPRAGSDTLETEREVPPAGLRKQRFPTLFPKSLSEEKSFFSDTFGVRVCRSSPPRGPRRSGGEKRTPGQCVSARIPGILGKGAGPSSRDLSLRGRLGTLPASGDP